MYVLSWDGEPGTPGLEGRHNSTDVTIVCRGPPLSAPPQTPRLVPVRWVGRTHDSGNLYFENRFQVVHWCSGRAGSTVSGHPGQYRSPTHPARCSGVFYLHHADPVAGASFPRSIRTHRSGGQSMLRVDPVRGASRQNRVPCRGVSRQRKLVDRLLLLPTRTKSLTSRITNLRSVCTRPPIGCRGESSPGLTVSTPFRRGTVSKPVQWTVNERCLPFLDLLLCVQLSPSTLVEPTDLVPNLSEPLAF